MKINALSPDESNYLKILHSIAKSPKRLYYAGHLPSERLPTVAIVGTRRPSGYGREVTHRLSFDLAKRGFVIVSGLALGVDAIAHRAALEAGGTTIAVLGNALPDISPRTNRTIGEDIVRSGGALLSEYEPGSRVFASNFLARNRIVSGISDAIIITEATTRSGTLHTAARALEQGKEVFVVPGNITSPLSAGCNALIKQGAHVLTSSHDVIDILAPDQSDRQPQLPLGQTELETKIIGLLASGIRDGEEIMLECAVSSAEFNSALTMLEINGSIRPLGANQWTIR